VTVALIDSKAVGLVRQRPAAPTLAVRIDGLTVADVLGLSVHDALERSGRVSFGAGAEPPEDTPTQHQPVASRGPGGPGTVAA
jgi:hypothetical protein